MCLASRILISGLLAGLCTLLDIFSVLSLDIFTCLKWARILARSKLWTCFTCVKPVFYSKYKFLEQVFIYEHVLSVIFTLLIDSNSKNTCYTTALSKKMRWTSTNISDGQTDNLNLSTIYIKAQYLMGSCKKRYFFCETSLTGISTLENWFNRVVEVLLVVSAHVTQIPA